MHCGALKIIGFGFLFFCTPAQSQLVTSSFPAIFSYKVVDVSRHKTVAVTTGSKALSLFVFLSPECPLSQNYTKTLNQLQEKYKERVNLCGIIPGNAYTEKEVAAFQDKYQVNFKLFIDTGEMLTHYLNATVTPQAILLNNKTSLLYTGAIDNWVLSLGKRRLQVTEHYVQNAIEQSLQDGIVKVKKTDAIGCKINDY